MHSPVGQGTSTLLAANDSSIMTCHLGFQFSDFEGQLRSFGSSKLFLKFCDIAQHETMNQHDLVYHICLDNNRC